MDSKQKVVKSQLNNCDLNSRELAVSSKALKTVKLVWFSQLRPYNQCGLCSWALLGGLQFP